MFINPVFDPTAHQTEVRPKPKSRRLIKAFQTLGRRLGLLLLAVVSAGLLAACGTSSGAAPPDQVTGLEPAADFSFSLYQGEAELGARELNIADLRGKPVVLNFWAGLCPPCRAEMPDLQEFHDEFSDRVVLLGIDVGQFTGLGNQDDARQLLVDLGVTYPAGVTDDASIMREYSVLGMPTTVFINSRGELFRKWTGVLNSEKLAEISNEMIRAESG